MLTAAGMQAALAGSIASVAGSGARADATRGGRIRVARRDRGRERHRSTPAKQSNQADYSHAPACSTNGLTSLDGSSTPQPQLAEEFATKDAKTPGCSSCARA